MEELGIEMARSRVSHTVEKPSRSPRSSATRACCAPPTHHGRHRRWPGLPNIDELRGHGRPRPVPRPRSPRSEVRGDIPGWERVRFESSATPRGKLITVCTIENIDPMGVHARRLVLRRPPMQTISPRGHRPPPEEVLRDRRQGRRHRQHQRRVGA